MAKAHGMEILEDRPANAELIRREVRTAGLEFVARCVTTESHPGANRC
jgi:hypothetical protein